MESFFSCPAVPMSQKTFKWGTWAQQSPGQGWRRQRKEKASALVFCHLLNLLVITGDLKERPESAPELKTHPGHTFTLSWRCQGRRTGTCCGPVGKMCPSPLVHSQAPAPPDTAGQTSEACHRNWRPLRLSQSFLPPSLKHPVYPRD